jgi:hypothetical protein
MLPPPPAGSRFSGLQDVHPPGRLEGCEAVTTGGISRRVMAVLIAVAGSMALPAEASNCVMGAQVTDRKGRTGTVVKMDGKNSCHVQFAGGGKPELYLQWQLTPAGKTREQLAGSGALPKGNYSCWAAGGIAGTMKLTISGTSSYAGNGKGGSYRYDEASQKIEFTSGPWGGMYGKRLAPSKIGVSSRPGGPWMTTCDLK